METPGVELTLGWRLRMYRHRTRLRNRDLAMQLAMHEARVERLVCDDPHVRLNPGEVDRLAHMLDLSREDVMRYHDQVRATRENGRRTQGGGQNESPP